MIAFMKFNCSCALLGERRLSVLCNCQWWQVKGRNVFGSIELLVLLHGYYTEINSCL